MKLPGKEEETASVLTAPIWNSDTGRLTRFLHSAVKISASVSIPADFTTIPFKQRNNNLN